MAPFVAYRAGIFLADLWLRMRMLVIKTLNILKTAKIFLHNNWDKVATNKAKIDKGYLNVQG